LIRD